MARNTIKREGALQDLIGQLEDTAKQAGGRISEYLAEARVRERLADAADAINDVRLAVLRRVHGEPSAEPLRRATAASAKRLENMTVRELHELASERQVPGRSSMSKAELIDALRKG
jgi:Rho termination factor, N-terminal domain